MYHIAIWDDEQEELDRTVTLCQQVLQQLGVPHTIEGFTSTQDLIDAQNLGSKWHLIFLDILMGGPVGLSLAKNLRQNDAEVDIVFTTSCIEYALEGYDAFPTGYLLKPLSREFLFPVIERCVGKHKKVKTVTLQLGENAIKKIATKDILWIEVFRKELIIHCKEEKFVGVGSLLQILNQLPTQFYRSHRSFIVNLDEIAGVQKYEFVLKNKQVVAIAMRTFQQAQQKWLSYLQE